MSSTKGMDYAHLRGLLRGVVLHARAGSPHPLLGVAYAICGGVGIVLTATVGMLVLKQRLDWIGLVGIGLIVAGVVVINAFSKATGH